MCKHVQHLLRLPFVLKIYLFASYSIMLRFMYTKEAAIHLFFRYLFGSCVACTSKASIYLCYFQKSSKNGFYFHAYMQNRWHAVSKSKLFTSHSSFQSIVQTNLDFQRKKKPFNHLFIDLVYYSTHLLIAFNIWMTLFSIVNVKFFASLISFVCFMCI